MSTFKEAQMHAYTYDGKTVDEVIAIESKNWKPVTTLDQIGIECQTDKASVFTRTYATPKNYLVHYERFFSPLRMDPLKLIEIGAAGGESIRMWLQYFPNGNIYGIDVVENTNPYNTVKSGVDRRYTFIHANQSDPVMWAALAADTGGEWDICIDDGSHRIKDICDAFEAGWQFMRSGGYWAVEDLGCGYGPGSIFLSDGYPTHSDWVKALIDTVIQGKKDIDSVYCSRELVIIRKK